MGLFEIFYRDSRMIDFAKSRFPLTFSRVKIEFLQILPHYILFDTKCYADHFLRKTTIPRNETFLSY